MINKGIVVGLAIVLLGIVSLTISVTNKGASVVFCDVGQGDAAMVYSGYFQALVDVGPSGDDLNKCISGKIPAGDKKIDLVFVSHPQRDHEGALSWLEKNFEIGKVVRGGIGDIYRYEDLYFEILDGVEPNEVVTENENDDSLVVLFKGGGRSVLFTGDIGFKRELALIANGVLEKIDVLKVAHHGSKYSTGKEFLEKVRPGLAVISVGEKNSYGHPSREVLILFEQLGVGLWRTDKQGELVVKL